MSSKRCLKCLCEKPLDAFYKHAQMGDGHLNKCIDCTKKDANMHRQENLERIRSYDRMRASMPHRLAAMKETVRKYAATFPQRKKDNTAVGDAVRDGRLNKQP